MQQCKVGHHGHIVFLQNSYKNIVQKEDVVETRDLRRCVTVGTY